MADIHHCPLCGSTLSEDEPGWWCHLCSVHFSDARIAAEEEPPDYQHPEDDDGQL